MLGLSGDVHVVGGPDVLHVLAALLRPEELFLQHPARARRRLRRLRGPRPAACFIQRIQVFANGQRCDDINYYGRTVAVRDLLKGREYNRASTR